MHTKSKNLGIASVEAVFIFPVILLLFVLMLHITKAMMTNIDVINESRLTAWSKSIEILPKLRANQPIAKSGNPISSTISYEEPQNSTSLIDDMRGKGRNKHANVDQLTSVLDGQELRILVAKSSAGYSTSRAKLNWSFNVEKNFALVATPIWTVDDIPYGYDKYLKDTLDSRCIFTKLFPNVTPKRSPVCKKSYFSP